VEKNSHDTPSNNATVGLVDTDNNGDFPDETNRGASSRMYKYS
jgi:hypothetical protein